MCVIVYKPDGAEISTDILFDCWMQNPDGAGFMYSDGTNISVLKGFMSWKKFHDAFLLLKPYQEEMVMAFHFRIKTHGPVSEDLTHPFWISKNEIAMMHNGIINVAGIGPQDSDSSTYAKLLSNVSQYLFHDGMINMIEKSTAGSRLLFMNKVGNVKITQEDNWVSHLGCQFSNRSFMYSDIFKSSNGDLRKSVIDEFYLGKICLNCSEEYNDYELYRDGFLMGGQCPSCGCTGYISEQEEDDEFTDAWRML